MSTGLSRATCWLAAALLLLSPSGLAAAPSTDVAARTSTELAKLASGSGSAVELWRAVAAAAADQAVSALQASC